MNAKYGEGNEFFVCHSMSHENSNKYLLRVCGKSNVMGDTDKLEKKELDFITLQEMRGWHFVIPYEQRGYRWRVQNVLELFLDYMEFVLPGRMSKIYCMQPLALEEIPGQQNCYRVWDGQQRLTTIYLLYKAFGMTPPFSLSLQRDEGYTLKRENFLSNPIAVYEATDDMDTFYMKRAFKTFIACSDGMLSDDLIMHRLERETFNVIREKIEKDKTLIQKIRHLLQGTTKDKHIDFIYYNVPSDKAIEIFHNLNSGKIELTNSELIKALILSDSSKLPNKELTAIQFAEMERSLMDDRFWFMMQPYEVKRRFGRIDEVEDLSGYIDVRSKLRRIDMLFNITAGVSFPDYKSDPIASFRYFFQNKDRIVELWETTRTNLRIMMDMYNDVHYYHYWGFITYCKRGNDKYKKLKDILNIAKTESKDTLCKRMREDIKSEIRFDVEKLRYKDREDVRRVLLLHNILTILDHYDKQSADAKLKLQEPFEVFPFDLLYRQVWHIEHMASQTDNEIKTPAEQNDWFNTNKKDYEKIFTLSSVKKKVMAWESISNDDCKEKKNKFDELYSLVIEEIDKELGDDKVIEKDGIGNLVLLDRHTNTGYHNALYPHKRRCIISATVGGKEMPLAFVPLCTRYAFTKFFNKDSVTKLTEWTQTDYEVYQTDIKNKLTNFNNK